MHREGGRQGGREVEPPQGKDDGLIKAPLLRTQPFTPFFLPPWPTPAPGSRRTGGEWREDETDEACGACFRVSRSAFAQMRAYQYSMCAHTSTKHCSMRVRRYSACAFVRTGLA